MRTVFLLLVLTLTRQIALCQAPAISSFAPSTGPIGTQVVINGNNFSANSADNIVYFGAVKAPVLAASTTSLTVTVPLGATFQPLSVTVGGLTASAVKPFIVTYAGGGMDLTASSFDAAVNFSGGGSVTDGDLDGDGKIDLVSTLFTSDLIRIYRNTRQGNVVSFATTSIGGMYNPVCVKAADMNGDGLLDLVVAADAYSVVHVLKNKSTPGTIAFESGVSFVTGSEPRQLSIGDIDNDGKSDIAVTNTGSRTISVLRNTSSVGTISFSTKVDFATLVEPEGICIGDLDGDGKREIAVAAYGTGGLSVFRNTSIPGSISFAARADYATNTYPWDVHFADVDGDGKLDMLGSVGPTSAVAVFRNTSSVGSISFATRVDVPVWGSPHGMAASDLNADGKPDVVTATWSYISLASALKNNSTPGTIAFAPYVGYTTDESAGDVVLADLSGDGLTDIVTANSYRSTLSYFQNRLNINTSIPTCPVLLSPARNAANVDAGVPLVFKWQKNANATSYRLRITEQSGAYNEVTTTDSFYVFNAAAGTTYTWNVTPVNMPDAGAACPAFTFTTCPVSTNTYLVTAEGNTNICSIDSVKLKAAGAVNIQWFLDQQPLAGAVADSFWAKKPGNYTVRIVNGSCYSPPSNSITVTQLSSPAKPVLTLGGSAILCEGRTLQLTSSVNQNNQWFKDNAVLAGYRDVSDVASTAGRYFVQVQDAGSGCYNYSDTVKVAVYPVPPTPTVSVTGNVSFCIGDSAKLQSSATADNQWLRNGMVIVGALSPQYTAKESGTYTVVVSAFACNSAPSNSTVITVGSIPAKPSISITGSTTFCSGDSARLRSSAASGNQWLKNSSVITTVTSQDYIVKDAGTYSVKTIQNGCASAASNNVNITVNALPVKPVITAGGTTMSTAAGYRSYQWYINNTLIPGAVNNQYNTTQNGMYRVDVTDINGCKNSSNDFNYITTALNDVMLEGYTIQLFPNPVHDDLIVKTTTGTGLLKPVSIRIVDTKGQLVGKEQVLNVGANTIPMHNLPNGIYWVILKSSDSQKTVKIFKAGSL